MGDEAQAEQAGREHAVRLEMLEQRRTPFVGDIDEDDVGGERAHRQSVDVGQALREALRQRVIVCQALDIGLEAHKQGKESTDNWVDGEEFYQVDEAEEVNT